MATTIKLRRSEITSLVPTNLELGELALNVADGKLYFKNVSNAIALLNPPSNISALASEAAVSILSSTGTGSIIPAATTTKAGVMTAVDKTKLDGIAVGATANATDAQLRDRATQTGVQDISTITGLQTALDGKLGTSSVATAANRLATPRQINGSDFDGTVNVTTANWGTSRNITIGKTLKAVDGSANVTWPLSDIATSSTKASILAKTANEIVTPTSVADLASWSSLGTVSASSLMFDLATSLNFSVTVGANMTITLPANITGKEGLSGDIVLTISGARSVSWATNWKFANSVPQIGTDGSRWVISYKILSATEILAVGNKLA